MKRYIQVIKRIAAVTVSGFIMAVAGFPSTVIPVFAESINEFDNSAVEEDLKDADMSGYPIDSLGSPAVASFMEYCYTDNVWYSGNYALYVYVYNPGQEEFSYLSGANTISLAVRYDESGEPADYENLSMKLCGATTGKYERLIYKFRVENVKTIYDNAVSYEDTYGYRRYDIGEIQLQGIGSDPKAYEVGRQYKYTGYAKGYSEESETQSTLKSEWKKIKTISLDVKHTNYRMSSEYKDYTRHEVNTVYFSVPDEYITDYGNLQKIKAEWYEYKTSPIFVTEDSEAYNALKGYVGRELGEKNEELNWRIIWDFEAESVADITTWWIHKVYNKIEDSRLLSTYAYDKTCKYTPLLSWLFSTDGAGYESYKVSSAQIESWSARYAESYGKEKDILGKYSGELFSESIDAERVQYLENAQERRGKIVREFDAADEFNLLSYDDTHSGWQRFWDYFGNWSAETGGGKAYSPIEEITAENFTGNKATDCKNLLLNEDNYETFSNAYNAAKKANEHLFVFRFAQTDYYSCPAKFDNVSSGGFVADTNGYVSEQTVFLNYDTIWLGFQKEETVTIIPAVQSPMDIWNAVDPPVDPTGDWLDRFLSALKWVARILCVIFFVWLLAKLFPPILTLVGYLFKGVFWLVTAPFKAIGRAINGKGKK